MSTRTAGSAVSHFHGPVDPAAYRRVLEAFTGVPATDGNRVDVLRNGDEIFPAMLSAIDGAQRAIDFMTFVYWRGDIAEQVAGALADRARAGVRVRVLLDAFGAMKMDDRLTRRMAEAGADVVTFRPATSLKPWLWNMRTHRRVLVCDETVAFTGGVGIGREWTGDADGPEHWRDTHFRVQGPAVAGVHAGFHADWLGMQSRAFDGADHFPVLPRVGDSAVQVIRAASQPGWNDSALALRALIALARRRIRITTAYFRPPQHFLDLLGEAVRRGVEVEVLVPGAHAHPTPSRWAAEFYFAELLAQGVRVRTYERTMIHAKVVTVDGTVAFVGTTNFDARSMAINEQMALVLHDPGITATLDRHFDEDCEHAMTVDGSAWRRRGAAQRAKEVAAHVATFAVRGGGSAHRGGLSGRLGPLS